MRVESNVQNYDNHVITKEAADFCHEDAMYLSR